MTRSAAVIGWGLQSALGTDPVELARRVERGDDARSVIDALGPLEDARAAAVTGPDFASVVKRRKDAKLLARPSQLLLVAARDALLQGETVLGGDAPDRSRVGIYVAVGREPPDDGQAEPALLASMREGRLDETLLATAGRDLYPPLLPLRTLPNMALAHVSIHLGIGGPNGTWAGGPEAGWGALCAGVDALHEGRADAVLVGGADSFVDLGSARDLRREGITAWPGEAAAMFYLVRDLPGRPVRRLVVERGAAPLEVPPALGWIGAASASVAVASLLGRGIDATIPR